MVKEMFFDYSVDEKNRVVVCRGVVPMYDEDGDEHYAVLEKAIARCREGDTFDEEFGKKLAQRKVLLKVNKHERQALEELIEETKDNLKSLCADYDKLNNELSRHTRKLSEIKAEKYPGEEN